MTRWDSHDSMFSVGADVLLWGGSFLLVVTLHVVGAVGFQPDRSEGEALGDPSVAIELDAISAAPTEGQSEVTPGPEQIETDQVSQVSIAQQEVAAQSPKQKEEASELDADLAKVPEPEIPLPDLPKKPEVKPEEEQREETEAESQPQAPSRPIWNQHPPLHPAQKLLSPRRSARMPGHRMQIRPQWLPGGRLLRLTYSGSNDFRHKPSNAVGTAPPWFASPLTGGVRSSQPRSSVIPGLKYWIRNR
jgi:hypothetical protein